MATVPFSVRFEPDELERIRGAAEAAGQSVSMWIRDAIVGRLEEPAAIDARLAQLLGAFIAAFDQAIGSLTEVRTYAAMLAETQSSEAARDVDGPLERRKR